VDNIGKGDTSFFFFAIRGWSHVHIDEKKVQCEYFMFMWLFSDGPHLMRLNILSKKKWREIDTKALQFFALEKKDSHAKKTGKSSFQKWSKNHFSLRNCIS